MDRQKITKTMLILVEVGILCAVIALGVFINASGKISIQPNSSQTEEVDGTHTQEPSETEETTSTEEEPVTEENSSTEEIPSTEDINTEDTTSSEDLTDPEETETRIQFSASVEEKLLAMTTEEKVAQLFLISPESITGVSCVTSAGNTTKKAIEKYPVGGFIYSKKNFLGSTQASTMIKNVNTFTNARIGLPMFIVVLEDAPSYSSLATLKVVTQEIGALAMEVGETPAVVAGILTCTATDVTEIIAAISGGMDMIYAPSNFTQIYGAVLEAVNNGTISQVRLENAVGNVLTEKME